MNYRNALSISILLTASITYAAIVVQGDDKSKPHGFANKITASVFERKSGTFYVGLMATAETMSGESSTVVPGSVLLAKATRPDLTSTPRFTTITKNCSLSAATPSSCGGIGSATQVEFLALAPQAKGKTVLPYVINPDTDQPEGSFIPFTTTKVRAIENDGSNPKVTDSLNDADGSTTGGIEAFDSSPCHILAAVRPKGANFGPTGSGIALVCIDRSCDILSGLTITDARNGMNGNIAAPLDETSTVLKGSGPNPVTFTGTCDQINTATPSLITIHYDSTFDRFYIATHIRSGGTANDVAKAVTVAHVDSGIIFNPIAPDTAIDTAENEVVVAKGANIQLIINATRVMHTSTGPSYLIVSGGITIAGKPACNRLYALPLVNDPSDPAKHGTLADKNAPLVGPNNVFTKTATMPGELAHEGEAAAMIGFVDAAVDGRELPIEPSDTISDIFVVGDTVYVSVAKEPSAFNDSGLFYSQAIFDNDGKIARWTPWVKRGVPLNAFPGTKLPCCAAHNGPIAFFAVDAKTGNIWIVEGNSQRVVGITNWNRGITPNDLASTLTRTFACGGATQVLDLDQGTFGFSGIDSTINRYALFGGANTVIFARVSQRVTTSGRTDVSAPQTTFTHFDNPENFLQTSLQGCVQALEYSRTPSGTDSNFFFAGTTKGLFAYADSNGDGFDSSSLSTLNTLPFSDRNWQKMYSIAGSIVSIKTSGADQTLFVIAQESSATQPHKSTLYRIPFTNNINTMFDPSNIFIVAQSNVGIFEHVLQFYGIQIIATGSNAAPLEREQLILATSRGLFKSNADQNNPPPTDQTDADWQLVVSDDEQLYPGITGMETPIPQTVWPWSQPSNCGKYDAGIIYQLSGNGIGNSPGTPLIGDFVPPQFNAQSPSPAFAQLPAIVNFFSDGARRFFIFNRLKDLPNQSKIGVLPYNVIEWTVSRPTILANPLLAQQSYIYWLTQIGSTGLILAGTNNGVLALE